MKKFLLAALLSVAAVFASIGEPADANDYGVAARVQVRAPVVRARVIVQRQRVVVHNVQRVQVVRQVYQSYQSYAPVVAIAQPYIPTVNVQVQAYAAQPVCAVQSYQTYAVNACNVQPQLALAAPIQYQAYSTGFAAVQVGGCRRVGLVY